MKSLPEQTQKRHQFSFKNRLLFVSKEKPSKTNLKKMQFILPTKI